MKLIGLKRAIILAVLFAINLAIAAVYFLQVMPMAEESARNLDNINSQISATSQKISSIKADLETFKTTLPQFRELEAKGFTLPQDRFRMSRDLDAVRLKAELGGFKFTINDIRKVDNPDIDPTTMQLIYRRIKVDNVESLLDTNFFTFIDAMQRDFPTHTRFQSMQMRRKDPLNGAALAKIQKKERVDLITAEAQFDWLTIIPKATEESGTGPTGGL
ncbi:MAG: hypothetical protein ACAH80_09620 [Alphaproteobacteria bacterium]